MGTEWKIMMDAYDPDNMRFADLKVLRSQHGKVWVTDSQCYENVYQAHGYYIQIAAYSIIEHIWANRPDGEYIEPILAVVTKEEPPDKELISFLTKTEPLSVFLDMRCNQCAYCRGTKVLTGTRNYREYEL
jgi:hypothetical protein